jgi:AcrR family transcriptional regulator
MVTVPRPRFAKLPPARRREILDVAARHFAASGFGGASLNRILEEASVSKGAAYYYFDDKGDLYATIVEDAWEEARRELLPDGFDLEALRGPSFWDTLERIYRRQLELLVSRPDAWRVVKRSRDVLADPSGSRLAPALAAFLAALGGALDQARRDGLVRRDLPPDLLLAMLGGVDDAVDAWLADHPDALTADPDLSARAFLTLRRLLEGPR